MSRWPQATLGDVAVARPGNGKIIKGTLPTENDGKLFPAYSATGQDVFSAEYDHEGDGIVVSAVGARCGKCFLASGRWRAIANTHVLLPRKDKISHRFLWYLINNEDFWIKGGSAQPFVKIMDSLRNVIPLPPLAEQERIIGVLDQAEVLRHLRTEADDRTEQARQAIFAEMFGDPLLNARWPIQALGEICGKGGIKAGPFGSSIKKDSYTMAGPRVYGQEQVIAGDFSVGDYHISDEKFAEMQAYAVQPGDVLISLVGTIGRAVVVPPGIEPGIINPRLLRIRSPEAVISPEFLVAILTSQSAVKFFANIAGGITMGVLNATLVKELRIIVPPFNLQEKYAARVAEIRSLEAMQTDSRKRLADLFQSLRQRAFQGEL
jgi:type I restriction enzyme S subunit